MSPPWMDKNMLELWLRTQYGDLKVTELEVKGDTSRGDHHLSSMQRLAVKTESGDTHFLVVKCLLQEGTNAEVFRDTNFFRNEKQFYSDTLPRMHELLQRALPEDFEPLAPKCIHSCDEFLILEDLTPAGFKMGNRIKGLELKQCLLVMRSLARFHAASAVLYDTDPGSMTTYDVNFFTEPSMQRSLRNFFRGMTRTLMEELKSWPQDWAKYIDKLKPFQETFLDRVKDMLATKWDFTVLVHCDVWVSNLMFSDHGNMRFLDFQSPLLMSPTMDLHYFLATSPTADVIINHTDTLVQEYHNTLYNTLSAMGYTKKILSLEELLGEMDRNILYGLYSLVVPTPGMTCHPDCGHDLNLLFDKGVTAGPQMYGEKFKKTVEWLLPILDRKGAFDEK